MEELEFFSSFLRLILIFVIIVFFRNIVKSPKHKRNHKGIHYRPNVPPTVQNKQIIVPKYSYPYRLNDSVLTEKETAFYYSLTPILFKLRLNVFAKMRIADIVHIPSNHPQYMKWFNKIKSKHIDFIICKETRPVLLIEVDDYTHDRLSRKKRDEFVDKIFHTLNLPILHIRTWTEEALEHQIKETLGIKEEAGI
jgi:hypothetical protein